MPKHNFWRNLPFVTSSQTLLLPVSSQWESSVDCSRLVGSCKQRAKCIDVLIFRWYDCVFMSVFIWVRLCICNGCTAATVPACSLIPGAALFGIINLPYALCLLGSVEEIIITILKHCRRDSCMRNQHFFSLGYISFGSPPILAGSSGLHFLVQDKQDRKQKFDFCGGLTLKVTSP